MKLTLNTYFKTKADQGHLIEILFNEYTIYIIQWYLNVMTLDITELFIIKTVH